MTDKAAYAAEQTRPHKKSLSHFSVSCRCRELFDQIADKWSMMILVVLDEGPTRFNEIKRYLEGVSQKSLTQALRKLERNGLVERKIIPAAPIGVEYSLTELGTTLLPPYRALYCWTQEKLPQVDEARAAFDAKN